MRTLTKARLAVHGMAVVAVGLVLLPGAAASAADQPGPGHACKATELLRNGSFEQPRLKRGQTHAQLADDNVPGWHTADPAGKLGIWGRGTTVAAADGRQYAALTANGSIYQDVRTVPGERLTWSLFIRARSDTDTDTTSIHFAASPRPGQGGANSGPGWGYANTAEDAFWKTLYGYYVVPHGQTWTRVQVNGDGNLVDDVSVLKGCPA